MPRRHRPEEPAPFASSGMLIGVVAGAAIIGAYFLAPAIDMTTPRGETPPAETDPDADAGDDAADGAGEPPTVPEDEAAAPDPEPETPPASDPPVETAPVEDPVEPDPTPAPETPPANGAPVDAAAADAVDDAIDDAAAAIETPAVDDVTPPDLAAEPLPADEAADEAADALEADTPAAAEPASADEAVEAVETGDAAPPPAGGSADAEPAAAADGRVPPPFEELVTNDEIVALIKEEEGLRLEAYQGPSGKWLIGYGHGGEEVVAGMTIDVAEAERMLRDDLAGIEQVVKSLVTVPLNVGEFSAMVDLSYNIGLGAFQDSSVLRLLNEGDRAGAADAFLLWNKITQGGERVESPVLTARREFERAMFLGETTP